MVRRTRGPRSVRKNVYVVQCVQDRPHNVSRHGSQTAQLPAAISTSEPCVFLPDEALICMPWISPGVSVE